MRYLRCAAYTEIEVLVTVAALFIGLGGMISLARHVRAGSANDQTKDLLRSLDLAMARYVQLNNGLPPKLPPLIADGKPMPDEAELARRAEANNQAVVRLLKTYHVFPADRFEDLSISFYDNLTVRDAWGNPIVFMPRMHPAIGMSPAGWFFFSAGPDRAYITKRDNLYSYELSGLNNNPSSPK